MTTLEKKVNWAQEVLSRKDIKLQEVKSLLFLEGMAWQEMPWLCVAR